MPITPTGSKNESKNEKYQGDAPQSKPTIEKQWGWNCSEKVNKDNPCNSEPIYQKPNVLPPDVCTGTRKNQEKCKSDSFDKHPGDLIKVTHEGKSKIIDQNQKSDDGKPGRVLKEYTE